MLLLVPPLGKQSSFLCVEIPFNLISPLPLLHHFASAALLMEASLLGLGYSKAFPAEALLKSDDFFPPDCFSEAVRNPSSLLGTRKEIISSPSQTNVSLLKLS